MTLSIVKSAVVDNKFDQITIVKRVSVTSCEPVRDDGRKPSHALNDRPNSFLNGLKIR